MVNSWVHPSVDVGTTAFEQHTKFIGSHLLMGCAVFFFAPALLAAGAKLDAVLIGFITCMASPMVWAWLVSRNGKLVTAIKCSLASLAALIACFMMMTGGPSASVMALLIILPIEAALRGGNISLRFAFSCAFAALAAVAVVGTSLTPKIDPAFASNFAAFVAAVYGATLAVRLKKQRALNHGLLRSEQERFKLMAQNSNELITRHDVDGATLFASPGARPLVGLQASALLKSGFLEQVHLQDRVHFLQGLSGAVHDGKESEVQLRLRCKGNEAQAWKWVETRMRFFDGADDGQASVVAVTRDISKSKSQELALQQAAERSEASHHAQRRFITTMSHELRTPLNAILGFSDMLRQELFGPMPDKRQAEYVGLIHDSGQHLLQVVNDMLDMSRIEAGRYELNIQAFQPIEIAQATLKMLEPMASAGGVTVVGDVDSTLPEMSADKRACQQVLINLVSNAIKFTPQDGLVRISAKQHGRSIKFRVKDNGIGIDKEFLSSLGQPFMQADNGRDRAFEGTGLGLTVVKGLVGLHGGEFDVVSTKGKGTTVTVTLPLRTAVNRAVPADQNDQLVRLDGLNRPAKTAISTASSSLSNSTQTLENEGENRARVSA